MFSTTRWQSWEVKGVFTKFSVLITSQYIRVSIRTLNTLKLHHVTCLNKAGRITNKVNTHEGKMKLLRWFWPSLQPQSAEQYRERVRILFR